MDMIILLPQHWASILAVCIMIGTLVVAYVKRWMMTYALILANMLVFIITLFYSSEVISGIGGYAGQYSGWGGLGFRAIYLTPELFPQIYTLFTSMFIHGGFAHIFGNMLVLFFVGVPFEERVGWKKFLIIYFLTGIIGALTHSVLNPNSPIPLIGASGAIFGIMGAFAFSYPRDEVVMPIPVGFFMVIRRIKVVYAVLIFAAFETFIVFLGVQDNTAHLAHLGGLLGGFLLAALLIRKRDKDISSAGFQTTYHDSYIPEKTKRFDYSNLRSLATTPELRDVLKRIENETVPQVREIWLEHFIEKTRCPRCGEPLYHLNRRIWCEKCGFKIKY